MPPVAVLAAWAFVLIWSTGFIVARLIAAHADPNLFLSARFALVALIFSMLVLLRGQAWPSRSVAFRLLGIGALAQGLYLGAGFWAVSKGMQPGVMALIGALQPPLTALFAWRLLQERPTRRMIVGLALGVLGVMLAVAPGFDAYNVAEPTPAEAGFGVWVILASVVSILAITIGTLLQRTSAASVELIPASALQNLGALPVVCLLAVLLGETHLSMDLRTLAALAYAVCVLSIGGFTLLIWLVRNGGATRASSLLFLAPPLAGIVAWWLFDDQLTVVQIAGFIVALAGVLLARR